MIPKIDYDKLLEGMPTFKESLSDLVKQMAIKKGKFTLSSGKESDTYLDLRVVSLDSDGATCIGNLILDYIEKEMPNCVGVAGMSLGADPIVASVLFAANQRNRKMQGILIRKKAKGHGTESRLEGGIYLEPTSEILVVDDVATSGNSLLDSVKALRSEGYNNVSKCLVIIDREEGALKALTENSLSLHSIFTLSELLEEEEDMSIYDEIKKERKRQGELWGDDFDDQHSSRDWCAFLHKYVVQADISLDTEMGIEDPEEFRENMVKVAAIAVAAVETLDRNKEK